MVERISALAGHLAPRRIGIVGPAGPGIRLHERRLASLWQIAAWPERLAEVGAAAAAAAGAGAAPGPGRAMAGTAGTLLRTEPVKWLLAGTAPIPRPEIAPADGTVLDLSHARTVIRIEGPAQADLLARLVPLDLREAGLPECAVATSGLHKVAVTLNRRDGGVDLYAFRSFGLSLWEHIIETAAQFGVEVV